MIGCRRRHWCHKRRSWTPSLHAQVRWCSRRRRWKAEVAVEPPAKQWNGQWHQRQQQLADTKPTTTTDSVINDHKNNSNNATHHRLPPTRRIETSAIPLASTPLAICRAAHALFSPPPQPRSPVADLYACLHHRKPVISATSDRRHRKTKERLDGRRLRCGVGGGRGFGRGRDGCGS